MSTLTRRSGVLSWFVVVMVGVLVLILVFGLQLFTRLNAGQRVLNTAAPAFASKRAAADPAAINMVSNIVNLADPIMETNGGATSDISNLVTFLATQTGQTSAQITADLSSRYPQVTHLIEASPLSAVTAEVPGLLAYVGTLLNLTPAQVSAVLPIAFPHLAQAVNALKPETTGWDAPLGMGGLTNFAGKPLITLPQAQPYLQNEVVSVIPGQEKNFHRLKSDWPPVHLIAGILTAVGVVVIIYGLIMMVWARARHAGTSRWEGSLTWGVVTLVGALVLVLVFAFAFYPRLDGANKMVKALNPVFKESRVNGDVGAVNLLSNSVNLLDPVMTPSGGAATDISHLLSFLATQTGQSQTAIIADLSSRFPNATALLEAVPFTGVTAELPGFESYVGSLLGLTQAQVQTVLPIAFPHLAQSVHYLPLVTGGWLNVPGTAGLTRFNGTPATDVVQVRNYFQDDVVPVLVKRQQDYTTLTTINPPLSWFPTLLTIVGLLVIVYGVAMIVLANKVESMPGRRRRGAET